MNFSKIVFNKELHALNFKDLVEFFKTIQYETINIEFKSYPECGKHSDKENSIKKAICGLLNSEGGIVIWGAPVEKKDRKGNTTAQGNLTAFVTDIDRDKIINSISSTITPMPLGVKVQSLASSDGKFVFVFEVPKSTNRPHQFSNRYYVRLDGQTRIAPHYLVSALFKSVDYPELRGHVRLKNIVLRGENYYLRFKRILFNSSEFINEINVTWRLATYPGKLNIGTMTTPIPYSESHPLLSYGVSFPFLGHH